MYTTRGFTLLEITLVIGVIGIMLFFSVPAGLTLYKSQLVESARDQVREVLARARNQSILQKNDSAFGVDFSSVSDTVVLFQGTAYGANPSYNELYTRQNTITITPFASSVYFAKRSGLPSATGTITLSDGTVSKSLLMDTFGNVIKQ